MGLVCTCSAFSQEEVKAPKSLDGASIRIKTAEEKEMFCNSKDLCIVLYMPQGNTAQLIFTHATGIRPQKNCHEKLSGDESYDAKENKGTPALLTFTAVKGSVYHAAVEGYWTATIPMKLSPYRAWRSFSLRTYPFMGMRSVSNSSLRRKNLKSLNVPEIISNLE